MMTQERPGAIEKTRRNTVWKRRLWLIRKSPLTLIGGAIMLIMLFLMIFSPWLVPHDPNAIDLTARLQAPSLSHWFGTDEVGRDLLVGLPGADGVVVLERAYLDAALPRRARLAAEPGLVGGDHVGNVDLLAECEPAANWVMSKWSSLRESSAARTLAR